ncbi:MAG: TolB-like 6-bladed beta-propeller domain-containing protein [Bacteroidales bacterium]|nr:TolB-like 6-bladed beta-propeller domain-containing protein [Bacteroidales bacterium]
MKKLIYILLLLCLYSCSSNTKYESFNAMFASKPYSKVKTIPAFPELNKLINYPKRFLISNNSVVICSRDEDTLVLVEDRNTKSITKIITTGQGPKDIIDISNICSENGLLYIMGFYERKMLVYDEINKNIEEDTSIRNTLLKYICSTEFKYDSDNFICSMVENDDRFLLKNQDTVVTFGKIAPFDDYTSVDIGWILQSAFDINKKQKRVFWCSGIGDVYGIYDYSDIYNIKTINESILKFPIRSIEDKRASTDETMFATYNITSNDDYVFMLFSGKTFKDINLANQDAIYDSKYIFVFDWDGNPIKYIYTDHDIHSICFDNKDNKLYGIELNNEYEYSICEIPLE